MSFKFADSVTNIELSLIRQFNKKKNDDTLNLGLGQLPFEQPPGFREAGAQSFKVDELGYGPTEGDQQLRAAVAEDFNIVHGVGYSANNVAITLGAEHALDCAYRALLNPGDVVLIPQIHFSVYSSLGILAGVQVVDYNLDENYQPDVEHIKELLDAHNVKLLVLNSPANPTGAIISDDSLADIASACEGADQPWIVSDEVYSKLVFTGRPTPSIATHYSRSIVVSSISKIASAAGARIGWVLAEVAVIEQIAKVIQHSVTSAPAAEQAAARAYFENKEHTDTYVLRLRHSRDFLAGALKGTLLEGMMPEGAFYYFADISEFGTSVEVADRLLAHQNVLVIPGRAFGEAGDTYVRISYAVPESVLKEAIARIKEELQI